ncbi:PilN domain-containing protein [Candidatus Daviesbacteria bacterium]|nr:PilN domain-containing protein [Candidatus Daviesbacteria bacterium]
MAAPKKAILRLNLLFRQDKQPKILVRLLRWSLGSGRFIVVIVEMLVIGAFLYRFSLDAKLSDLRQKIKDQAIYIQSQQSTEDNIRRVQFQISQINQIKTTNPDYTQPLNRVAASTPQTIKINTINFDRTQSFPKTTVLISGISPSNVEINAFIQALQKDSSFIDINLNNISFDQTGILFTVSGSLKEQGAKNS